MSSRALLTAVSLAALAVAAACTSGDGYDSTPTPTPTPVPRTFSFTGVDYTAHAGFIAAVRVLDGTTVVFCGTSGAITTDFTITAPGTPLEDGKTYSVETFADLNTDNRVYDEANQDHNWSFTIGPVTSNVAMSFVHFSVPESAITWTENMGCPGS